MLQETDQSDPSDLANATCIESSIEPPSKVPENADSLPPTYRQSKALQEAYDFLNLALFDGSLKPCILTLSGRSKDGYFAPDRWVDEAGRKVHEIGLNPLLLSKPEIHDVMATLVHNMTHQWQWEQGETIDRRKTYSGYHNKEWAMKLSSLGLMPSDTGKEDGKATGFVMSQYVVTGGEFSQALLHMQDELPYKARKTPFKGKSKSPKLTYICEHPGCEKRVWGAPDIQIRCACGKGEDLFLPDPKET